MILSVLKEFYEDEYSMMEYLSMGDIETFYEFVNLSPYYTNHLLGYGIIERHRDTYNFKIESVREYLAKKLKYQKLHLTQEETLREISERRNALELKLRHIIRNQLRASFGKASAKNIILDILGESRKSELAKLSYEDLFDPNKSEIYLDDLRKIVLKNWDQFKHIFTKDKQDFDIKMQFINKLRADAHAKNVDLDEIYYFRTCIGALEKQIDDFLE